MILPNVALSLRQPWAHAVIHGGKRIENRLKWKNSHFRGPVLLHTAKGMTRDEYLNALLFARERGMLRTVVGVEPWDAPELSDLQRGGIVGVATVVGVVDPDGPCVRPGAPQRTEYQREHGLRRPMRVDEEQWWMGGFALVLDDVRPLPFVPCKGMLGFFKVPPDVMQRLAP